MQATTDYVCSKLSESNTTYKRRKMKQLDKFYVDPQLKAVGTRFELKKDPVLNTAFIERLQCTYPFVSIVETCKKLFQNENYLNTFMKYNEGSGNNHDCESGQYIDFCCGSVFAANKLFKENKMSLQIDIFSDDFEICNPLGSKATLHKICGVYFAIRNMPANSQLSNIYLVSLCNTDDLHTKNTDFNNLLTSIVNDIKFMETTGIDITLPNGMILNIKGTLVASLADNLGANTVLGLVESFSANFYCKNCELSKEECKRTYTEITDKLRSRGKYEKHLKTIEDSTKVNFDETTGIKRYCFLNNLSFYHTTENITADPMHDLNEGVLPFAMRLVFKYCITNKLMSEDTLSQKIQYYDYGILERKNTPSAINLEKSNLNQNAAQSMCMFHHLPFILREYKNQLEPIWPLFSSLQNIVKIVSSRKLRDSDVDDLQEHTSDHLKYIREECEERLLPKHHSILHYSTIIRRMGSIRRLSTIRWEAKHQTFKQDSRNLKNFKSVCKTLALKHQKRIAQKIKSYSGKPRIEYGKKTKSIVEYEGDSFDTEVKWVRKDNIMYRPGLFVLHSDHLFEIKSIFVTDDDCVLFCSKYLFTEFDKFTNSLKIEKLLPEVYSTIKFSSLCNEQLLEKKIVDGEYFIIIENLEIQNAFEKTH